MEAEKDLLYGVKAIAKHLQIRERQAYHLIESTDIPCFKLGGKVCGRAASLNAWLSTQEAKSIKERSDHG